MKSFWTIITGNSLFKGFEIRMERRPEFRIVFSLFPRLFNGIAFGKPFGKPYHPDSLFVLLEEHHRLLWSVPRGFVQIVQHLVVASHQAFGVINERCAVDLLILPVTLTSSFVSEASEHAQAGFGAGNLCPWFRSFHEPISFERYFIMKDAFVFHYHAPPFWLVFQAFLVFFRNVFRSRSLVCA